MPSPPKCEGCGLECERWRRARNVGSWSGDGFGKYFVEFRRDVIDPVISDEYALCDTCSTLVVLGLHPHYSMGRQATPT